MKFAAFALAAAAVPFAAAAQSTNVNLAEKAPIVTLTVTESVEAAPDIVTVGTGVETRAPTAKQAMADNAQQMKSLIAALGKAGIAKKDIQTSGLRLNAQYDYSARNPDGTQAPPKFIGYEASNQLTVKLRDVKRAGELLDQMVAAGATNISGPNFTIDDPAPLLVQARGQAIKTAAAQAQYYAQQTGYRSARLISIAESNSGGMPPQPMMQRMKADSVMASTPIEPGQVASSVTVTVQYALEQ
jgi:uncharacterized protein YggE